MYKYDYFDHDADIGIIGYGKSLEEAFEAGAYAMFAIMANVTQIVSNHTIEFSFEESDTELAFVTWLNLLIAYGVEKQLLFNRFQIHQKNNHWYAKASGASWQNKFEAGTEVKGATLTELSVKKINQDWEVRCVVDV